MKKWIPAAVAVLLVWNICLSVWVAGIQMQPSAGQTSSENETTIVNNTINGYTTDITETAAKVQPAIVIVRAYQEGLEVSSVSGVVFSYADNTAYIVTNAAIASGESDLEVQFDNGEQLKAEICGTDSLNDIALLKVKPEFDVEPIALGDSDAVTQGEYVIAIGGRSNDTQNSAISFGVVSAPGQILRTQTQDETYVSWVSSILASDITVNTSNTGGALVNLDGDLIGLLSRSISSSSSSAGVSGSLAVNELKLIVEQLMNSAAVARGYLGVIGTSIEDLTVYQKSSRSIPLDTAAGVLVTYVEADSPAAMAGITAGDVILQIQDIKITDSQSLREALYTLPAGTAEGVTILRGGEQTSVSVTLQ